MFFLYAKEFIKRGVCFMPGISSYIISRLVFSENVPCKKMRENYTYLLADTSSALFFTSSMIGLLHKTYIFPLLPLRYCLYTYSGGLISFISYFIINKKLIHK